jgi:hypothetical protein
MFLNQYSEIRIKHFALFLLVLIIFSCEDKELNTLEFQPYHYDGEIEEVIYNGPGAVYIVFIGDGYTKADLKIGGIYETRGHEVINGIFSIEPFKTYKKFFNVYIGYAVSIDKGADTSKYDDDKDTRFNTFLKENGSYGYKETQAFTEFSSLVDPTRSNTIHFLLSINSNEGCTATGSYGSKVSIVGTCRINQQWQLFAHELGHSLANLADEYYKVGSGSKLNPGIKKINGVNADITNNLDSIKWKHFINLQEYFFIGAYEGGYHHEYGVWRPEKLSIMKGPSYPYFNAPSREGIVKEIFKIIGKEYNYKDFLKNDIIPDGSLSKARIINTEICTDFFCENQL